VGPSPRKHLRSLARHLWGVRERRDRIAGAGRPSVKIPVCVCVDMSKAKLLAVLSRKFSLMVPHPQGAVVALVPGTCR
jgi:hypothetical protein